MKSIAAWMLISCLCVLSCSKQENDSLPEKKEESATEASGTMNTNSISKLDSLLLGSWRYLGSSVDHPPFFFEADPTRENILTFRNDNSYISIERSRLLDSGSFRVLDTTYYTSHTSRMVNKKSAFIAGTSQPTMYYLFLSNDTLNLSYGLGGSKYKRIRN